jgi:hypothetical protein
MFFVWTVTKETFVGQDRTNVAAKVNLVDSGAKRWRRGEEQRNESA